MKEDLSSKLYSMCLNSDLTPESLNSFLQSLTPDDQLYLYYTRSPSRDSFIHLLCHSKSLLQVFLDAFPTFDLNTTNAYCYTALEKTRDPSVIEFLLSQKRQKLKGIMGMLSTALINGETAIVTVILGHPRIKKVKGLQRQGLKIDELIESSKYHLEYSPERQI